MYERSTWTASVLWLLAGCICLTLPVFLPSSPNPPNLLTDPISLSTALMYVLSFPGGLLSLLFSPIVDSAFGIDPNSMQGMYLNLKMMFVLGLVQWFWIVPKMMRSAARRKASLLSASPAFVLSEAPINDDAAFVEGKERSPLERVFDENERR